MNAMNKTADQHDRLVTVEYFTEMLGVHRQWYYKHFREEGMPKRVYVGKRKPMLSLAECLAYVEQLKKKRDPQRRKRGRPRKNPLPGATPQAAA